MKKKAQPKSSNPAKGCLCNPRPKPLHPIGEHLAACPISKRYTVNGRIIADMMHSEKIRGNAKDYVILSGSSLIDFNGTFEMRHQEIDEVTGLPVGKEGTLNAPSVALVHKRNLHKIVGVAQAARFWKPGFGRVTGGG